MNRDMRKKNKDCHSPQLSWYFQKGVKLYSSINRHPQDCGVDQCIIHIHLSQKFLHILESVTFLHQNGRKIKNESDPSDPLVRPTTRILHL